VVRETRPYRHLEMTGCEMGAVMPAVAGLLCQSGQPRRVGDHRSPVLDLFELDIRGSSAGLVRSVLALWQSD